MIIKDTKQTSGKGRGTVLQDINASPQTVMDKVADLRNYHKVVPNGKFREMNYLFS